MADTFVDPYEDAEPKPAAGVNPATGQQFTLPEIYQEAKQAVLGPPSTAAEIEPSAAKRALYGAALKKEELKSLLTGQKPPENTYGITEDVAGGLGYAVPEIV